MKFHTTMADDDDDDDAAGETQRMQSLELVFN